VNNRNEVKPIFRRVGRCAVFKS